MNFSETEKITKSILDTMKYRGWDGYYPIVEKEFLKALEAGIYEGFKAGQESHINNKTLADILYRNGFNKALEEIKNRVIWEIEGYLCNSGNFKRKICKASAPYTHDKDCGITKFIEKINEALKKKES